LRVAQSWRWVRLPFALFNVDACGVVCSMKDRYVALLSARQVRSMLLLEV